MLGVTACGLQHWAPAGRAPITPWPVRASDQFFGLPAGLPAGAGAGLLLGWAADGFGGVGVAGFVAGAVGLGAF
ncbi:MAG: hypothetical protein KDC98_15365 [Planctomycetes bacterium]|nr:hypothetical protein [Planctomycetota bacterium]